MSGGHFDYEPKIGGMRFGMIEFTTMIIQMK